MFKGFLVTIVSYTVFIILPFLYLLMTVYALVTNHAKLALNSDTPKKQQVTQIYQA